MTNPRVRKIADRIQVIVAEMLERRIKDPRLGFVTVTDVRVTGDTQQATIFYTVLGEDERRVAEHAAALESAKGLIRSEVAKQLGMRHAPTLEFIPDALPETAAPPRRGAGQGRGARTRRSRRAARRDVRRRGRPVQEAARGRRRRRTPTTVPTTTTRDRRRPGLVVVDKPGGMTSHDVVARVRRLAGTRKVGHAGTLDPMATGVLVLGVDRATRLLGHLMLDREGVRRHDPARRRHHHRRRRGRGRRDGARPAALDRGDGPRRRSPRSSARSSRCRPRSRRSRSTASAPTSGCAAGEEVELAARPVTVHALDVHDVRRGDGDASTSTSRCAAPAAPTSARSPATSAPRSASAAT